MISMGVWKEREMVREREREKGQKKVMGGVGREQQMKVMFVC